MVIFGRTRGPVGGIISGGKSPVVPFLLQDREAGGIKANTSLVKIITGLNKVSVTGLGPGYIIPGPWPELTPLAL